MTPEGPTRKKQLEIDVRVPGYTVRALGAVIGLRPKESFVKYVDLQENIQGAQLNPQEPMNHAPGSLGLKEHRKEMAEKAGVFIDEAWSAVRYTLKQHEGKLLVKKDESDVGDKVTLKWTGMEEIKKRLESSKNFLEWEDQVYKMLRATFSIGVDIFLEARREDIKPGATSGYNLDSSDIDAHNTGNRNLRRLEELIGFGDHNIREATSNKPVDSVDRYILGGFETTISRALGYARLVVEVYKNKFHKNITKEELQKLTKRPALLSLLPGLATADTDMITNFVKTNSTGLAMSFDSTKFILLEKDGNLSLEMKPEELEQILNYLQNPENHKYQLGYVATGCPAHKTKSTTPTAEGPKFGERITLEVYDFIQKIILDLIREDK